MQAYAPLMNRIKEGYNKLASEITFASNTVIPGKPNTKKEYLSDSQAAQLYKSEVKGNPEVDANKIVERERAKIPKVVARAKQDLDFFGPINHGVGMLAKAVETGAAYVGDKLFKRSANSEQQPRCFNTPAVAWLQVTSYDYQLSVQLVGDISPASDCIGDLPIFIDGEPGQACELLPDYRPYPNKFHVLDFTNSPAVAAKCDASSSMTCVAPDANSTTTNEQINRLLAQGKDAYIYLSKEQMDNWLVSKKAGNETNSLRYIRVSPKTSDGMQRTTLGGIITSSLLGAGLLAFGGIYLGKRLCGDKQSETANSKETVAKEIDASQTPDSSTSSDTELSSVEV